MWLQAQLRWDAAVRAGARQAAEDEAKREQSRKILLMSLTLFTDTGEVVLERVCVSRMAGSWWWAAGGLPLHAPLAIVWYAAELMKCMPGMTWLPPA
jgi:hypothetical protein